MNCKVEMINAAACSHCIAEQVQMHFFPQWCQNICTQCGWYAKMLQRNDYGCYL